jgi:hypothetical protein
MNAFNFQVRRLAQRFMGNLPLGYAPFDELFPSSRASEPGIRRDQERRFTGVLREETGQAFAQGATCYADGRPGSLAGEDRDGIVREPNRRLFAGADLCVHGPHGIVYDPATRQVVRETLEHWTLPLDRHPIFATPRFPRATPLEGRSVLLATLGGQTFYHFFIEGLPKLALFGDLAKQADHVLVSRYGEEAKQRWLDLLGLSDRIVWIQELGHYRCEQLFFTNRLVRHFEPNPWGVAALRSLLPRAEGGNGKPAVVWLDRSRNPTRAIPWENELARRVSGARRVEMAELPPRETINLCANARALVGFHGAAFANMIFCPPGTKIVELMIQPFHPWYARLAQVCGHHHLAVRVTEEEGSQAAAIAAIDAFLA